MFLMSLWRNVTQRRRVEADLDDEMRAVHDLIVDRGIAEGQSPADARRTARLEIGGIEQIKERIRDARVGAWLESIVQDLRFALRLFHRNPGFSILAIITLAIGIGAATAVFTVVDGVLLKPLPVKEQQRLLVVWKAIPERGTEHWPFSYASYEGMREQLRTFSGVAANASAGVWPATLQRDGGARVLHVAPVTGGWFEVLGVQPRAGRLLTATDDRPGAAPAVVLSSGAAQRLFGDAQNAVGRRLRLDNHAYTIVGIAPSGFEYPRGSEAWAAAAPFISGEEGVASLDDANRVTWDLVARVASPFTIEQARAELASVLGNLTTESTSLTGTTGVRQIIRAPLFADVVVGDARLPLLLLGAAVLMVLLIAGVNVANLLLARGLARQDELGVRSAIGATGGRIVRQFATEALLLSVAGAVLALFVADVALHVLLALAPSEWPRLTQIAIDTRALAFTGSAAVLVAGLCGMLPVVRANRVEATNVLRTANPSAGYGAQGYVLRHGLVVTQIAMTVLVLATAGLLLTSLDRMRHLTMGFAAGNVLLVDVATPLTPGRQVADQQRAMMRLAERAATVPGISHATALVAHPFAGGQGADILVYAEDQSLDESANPLVNYEGVDQSYFATLGLPILRGRGIESTDRAGSEPVVVVNDAFARLFWPGADPVGRRIKFGRATEIGGWHEWRRVVGLAADARYRELTDVRPSVYVPYGQGIPVSPCCLAVRTNNPAAVAGAIRRAVADEQPDAAVVGVTPLPRLMAEPLERPRFESMLVASFALLGIALSVVGVYGMLAFMVRQRTRDIGIRMALGADAATVRRFVLKQGLAIGGLGILLGLAAVAVVGHVIQPLLFGVSATDPRVLLGAAAALLAVTIAATLGPAHSATRTDPLRVMRSE